MADLKGAAGDGGGPGVAVRTAERQRAGTDFFKASIARDVAGERRIQAERANLQGRAVVDIDLAAGA